MQTRVDHFLPKAFHAIKIVYVEKKTFFKNRDEGVLIKEYKGYISSLGANIIQAGVKAAITFYEAKESGSKSDRRLVNAAIKYIIDCKDPNLLKVSYDDCNLSALLTNDEASNQAIAIEILDAATALKLALRTYKME